MGGTARGNGSPLQGFGASPTPTQGDALGWYKSAPLGLNTHGDWSPLSKGDWSPSDGMARFAALVPRRGARLGWDGGSGGSAAFHHRLIRNDAVRATGARPSGRRNAHPQPPLHTTRTRTSTHHLAVTLQSERGFQAAEAWIRYGASKFPDAAFNSLAGEWWHAMRWLGTAAAGGRFCGLKAALLSPSLQRYG